MARKMKDSGIEWIGKIPEDWEVKCHKYIMHKKKELCNKYNGENIISLTMGGVIIRDLDNPIGKMPASFDGYQKVYKGNLLLCLFDIDVTPRCVGYIRNDGLTSPAYSQFVMLDKNNPRFYDYLLRTIDDKKCFLHLSKNLRSSLTEENFGVIKSIVPPLIEQGEIADFLDKKCCEIDNIITKTKETIEDYKKYKQAIITEAVTRGLNLDVEMKDSGIEWLKEIPEKWLKIKIKYIAELNPRTNTSHMNPTDEVTFTPMDRIKNGFFLNNIGIWGNNNLSYNVYQEKDIVLAKVTPCFENGNIAIMENLYNGIGYGSSELFVFRANSKVDIKYLFYYLQNEYFKNLAQSTMTGAGGLKRVSSDFILNHTIPFPVLNEQKEIAKYLDIKCSEIDKIIAKKESLVEDLEAYKKSLIYEYVTGKKEVPESKIIPFPATINCKDKRFAQAVLLTKILDEFGEYHSGRVKVAKTLYVIENHIGFDFDTDTIRKVAGPLDEKFYKAEAVVRHNKWFNVLEQNSATRYFAGKDKQKYLEYYNRYFKDYDTEIQRIIDIFKDLNMNEAELLATAYASWNDAIIKGNDFSKDELVDDIFSWDDSKKRFPKEKWLQTFEELEQKNIVPIGHGKMTIKEKE